MLIKNKKSCSLVNERFGNFHDGFIKKIEISSGNKFCQEMPWEQRKTYATNEEKLLATGLCYFGGKLVKIVVHHNCYDWPNQPWDRAINIYIPKPENISLNIINSIGVDIFDLSFEFNNGQIELRLATHEIPPKKQKVSIEDCNIEVLCTFTKARVIETKYA